MCEPLSAGYGIAYAIAAIAGGVAVGQSMSKSQQGFQSAPDNTRPPEPTKIAAPVVKNAQPVQKAKAPDVQALRAANTGTTQSNRGTNATATMLTGAGGVDLTSLDIGRNTLLGGGG